MNKPTKNNLKNIAFYISLLMLYWIAISSVEDIGSLTVIFVLWLIAHITYYTKEVQA